METSNGALGAVPGGSEAERIQRVYHEIERRDGAAQWHTALWFRFSCLLAALLLVSLSAVVFLAMKASRVQAFIQPVQITDEGKMILVGIPQDLLAYQPDDGQWMDMLAQWIMKRRWKGDDEAMKRTRNDWGWLYRHTCGAASRVLQGEESTEHPFTPTKQRTSVEITSITRTATPRSYQVVWHEVSVGKDTATLHAQDFLGTFTVGRLKPTTLTDAMDNRLGICVNGYDVSPSSTRMP